MAAAASTSAMEVDNLQGTLPSLTTLDTISSDDFNNRPEFVRRDVLLQLWKCEHCGEILVQAQQTACGCRICKRCVGEIFREKKLIKPCPLPHDPMDDDLACKNDGLDREKIYADVSAQRNLLKELVFCSYRKFGCDQQILWRKLKEHITGCPFKPKQCPNKGCNELIPEQKFSEHQRACRFVIEGCQYCGKQVQRSKMELHLDECEKAEAKCEECGMTFSSKRYLLVHQSTTVKCLKFREGMPCYICKPHRSKQSENNAKSYKKAEELISHLNDPNTQAIHIQLLSARIESLESELEAQAQKQSEELKLYVKQRNEPLLRTVADTVLEMKKIEEKVESATTQADSLVNAMREVHKGAEQIASLKSKMESIERVFGRSGLDQPELISQLKASVKKLEEGYIGMDKRLKNIELATYNGELIWKIKDYKKLKLDAQKGRVVSLYSHPFYSSETGYKMCCRVYLNGDGVGRGHFLSIFFVVMKGEYDDLLQWPFKEKVTFKLICPSNQSRNKTETFMPDGNSSSFQKPQNDMNIASGCPQFLQQSQVEDSSNGYLVNDCIYVGIAVGDKSRFA